eukprot:NODE_698_length_1401_cov_248.054978.p1 GENE.NODE_698_length_1401_cov_248.054978~~NODE_698_length_1401_cov_248.054978.p1  ORF type:complete len:427 (+),score=109.13 NODE_698_length_1401_cov_248.054978:83-1282(+)
MVVQRHALSYPEPSVPLLCFKLPRNVAWLVGLIGYALANGLYGAALQLGPFALLASVFTTLLVFNMIFARLLLGEELTQPRIAGSLLVCLGVALITVATPSGVKTDFTPSDGEELFSRPAGAIYMCVLLLGVLGSVLPMCWYERRYPISHIREARAGAEPAAAPELPASSAGRVVGILDTIPVEARTVSASPPTTPSTSASSAQHAAAPGSAWEAHAADAAKPAPPPLSPLPEAPRLPPAHLDLLMGLIYPGSLGLDEGICHLTMKLTISMLAHCSEEDACLNAVVLFSTILWASASVATLWWMRTVFQRYEITQALPVEYGSVNIASICSGLIFYGEGKYMDAWQLALVIVGIFVIAAGIQSSRVRSLPCACNQLPSRFAKRCTDDPGVTAASAAPGA